MKALLLLFTCALASISLHAKRVDSCTMVINGKSITFREGDTLKLGYGANPDGSFMYLTYMGRAGRTSLENTHAGKYIIIRKIRYYKSLDQYELDIKGRGFVALASIPQAFDKKEIVEWKGVPL